MRRLGCLLFAFCLMLPLVLPAGEPGFRALLMGGTLEQFPPNAEGRIDLTQPDSLIILCHGTSLRVPYERVQTLEYGQHVSRRYAEAVLVSPILLLSKSRKHFVTLGYVDDEGRQQALVLRVSKGDVRTVIASLEARTGRKVEFQDDDARRTRG